MGTSRRRSSPFAAYWAAFCALLAVAAHLFYRRGFTDRFAQRLAEAGSRLTAGAATGRTDFRITIGTAADQIAVAPGYLQREWIRGSRRYFEYATDQPIYPFFSVSSARYEVARDRWNDVAISVYYDAKHPYNVERMIESAKRSLDYYTREFSPYQYREFRVLEFPRYRLFAQAFPHTIPYSEGLGFVYDQRDECRRAALSRFPRVGPPAARTRGPEECRRGRWRRANRVKT